MCKRRGENLHPGWGLANHDTDFHPNKHLYDVAFYHSNENQDTRLSHACGGAPISCADHTNYTTDSMAALAGSWIGDADDRGRLRQRSGLAPAGPAPAGRGAGTNIQAKPNELIPG